MENNIAKTDTSSDEKQKSQANNSCNNINLPILKKVFTDIEKYKEIGFSFADCPHDDSIYLVSLPDDWFARKCENDKYIHLIDNNGFKRAIINTDEVEPKIELLTRYGIYSREIDDGKSLIIYFGNDDEIVEIIETISVDDLYARHMHAVAGQAKAHAYVNKNYPGHNDPAKYWDINLIKDNKHIKKLKLSN